MTDTLRHGVRSTYTHHGCHCDECTAAQRNYMREYQRQRQEVTMDDGRGHPDISAWATHGLCVGEDPAIWHPTGGHGKGADWDTARAICMECPVRLQCLAHAVEHETFAAVESMWGGLTTDERRRIRRKRMAEDRRQRRSAR